MSVESPGTFHSVTVFGKHCECIAQKCTHLERLPPLASHLLLLSHCVLTRHGGKKSYVTIRCTEHPGFEPGPVGTKVNVSAFCAIRTVVPNGSYHIKFQMPIYSNFKSQLFAENGKIQLTPKISNHLFTCYLDCMCKSNPVCLIQQWSVNVLLGSYVQ